MSEGRAPIGVVIVAFNSADVILGCLDSLFASRDAELRVVVIDNQSQDNTAELVRRWAKRRGDAQSHGFAFDEAAADELAVATAPLTLLRSPVNGGYAHGVNAALRPLLADTEIQLFWVLNPDCEVTPDAAALYLANGADQNFSLMSGRTVYLEMPDQIQTDGGRLNRWTGVCSLVHVGRPPDTTPLPDVASLDFLTGANMVASRRFIEQAGPMREDYFLYYEEVDWAFRRGDLPLRLVDAVTAYHYGGTTIGTGSTSRRPSAFANYFNYRNRLRFMARFHPAGVPGVLAHALAKTAQLVLIGAPDEARGVLTGAFGLAPPRSIRDRIAPGEARRLAFGSKRQRVLRKSL